MTLLNFLICFLLLLIIGPLIIVGWYAITRGRMEYRADGTPFETGKIFKAWHFHWTKVLARTRTRIGGQTFIAAICKLQREYGLDVTNDIQAGTITFLRGDLQEWFDRHILWIQDAIKVSFEQSAPLTYTLYKKEIKYRFPEWMRDPLSECPTCMASVYGSLIWWGVQYFSHYKMFFWTWPKHVEAAVIFWPCYCIGCAYINTILAKKL